MGLKFQQKMKAGKGRAERGSVTRALVVVLVLMVLWVLVLVACNSRESSIVTGKRAKTLEGETRQPCSCCKAHTHSK